MEINQTPFPLRVPCVLPPPPGSTAHGLWRAGCATPTCPASISRAEIAEDAEWRGTRSTKTPRFHDGFSIPSFMNLGIHEFRDLRIPQSLCHRSTRPERQGRRPCRAAIRVISVICGSKKACGNVYAKFPTENNISKRRDSTCVVLGRGGEILESTPSDIR